MRRFESLDGYVRGGGVACSTKDRRAGGGVFGWTWAGPAEGGRWSDGSSNAYWFPLKSPLPAGMEELGRFKAGGAGILTGKLTEQKE